MESQNVCVFYLRDNCSMQPLSLFPMINHRWMTTASHQQCCVPMMVVAVAVALSALQRPWQLHRCADVVLQWRMQFSLAAVRWPLVRPAHWSPLSLCETFQMYASTTGCSEYWSLAVGHAKCCLYPGYRSCDVNRPTYAACSLAIQKPTEFFFFVVYQVEVWVMICVRCDSAKRMGEKTAGVRQRQKDIVS